MRLLFAGTPAVAAHTLTHLLDHTEHEIVAVLSRPDAPQSRSKRLVPSPVAVLAQERGIEVLRPTRASDPAFLDRLRELAPQACPVIAYGALLPQAVLDVPTHGWLNVHYSLLPRWRGAAPVQRAILAGDDRTGVTVFRLVAAMDAGPVFGTREVAVAEGETSGALLERLTPLGAELLAETIDALAAGSAVATDQPDDGITIAPKLTVAEAELTWTLPAVELVRLIRGCNPSPMAWTTYAQERFRVLRAETAEGELAPGAILAGRREVLVGTGTGALRLLEVQPQGKRAMPATAWANGLRGEPGSFA